AGRPPAGRLLDSEPAVCGDRGRREMGSPTHGPSEDRRRSCHRTTAPSLAIPTGPTTLRAPTGSSGVRPALRNRRIRPIEAAERARGLRFDQAATNRIASELDAIAHAELLEDVRAMALDRLHA